MSVEVPSLYALLADNAQQRPEQPAAINSARALSHAGMLQRVDRLAAGFSEIGLQVGDRVAILAQNSIEYLELYGACARNGLIAAPVNWRLTPQEIAAVLALTEPQLLVLGEQFAGLDLGIDRSYVLAEAVTAGRPPLSQLYQDAASSDPAARAELPFVIIPTAAVEGRPRGALLTQSNLVHAAQAQVAALELTSQDRYLAALPLYHIFALGYWAVMTVAGGATVVLESFDPAAAAMLIESAQVTLFPSFPPVLETLLEAQAATWAKWANLRYVVGLDKPETIQRLLNETEAEFWTGFGQSETTGGVTIGSAVERPGSAGKPLPGVELCLVDGQDRPVPAGEVGEIAVRGPVVFAGYWNDPEATAFAMRGGWHHTGDLGRLDEEGYLFYAGRKPEKELIKSGGENVYPAEVENVLQGLPQVEAACVFGVMDEKWGEAVKAVIELVPGQQLSVEQVIQAITAQVASYKKPRYIEFVAKLPRSSSGEIDRAAVKANYG